MPDDFFDHSGNPPRSTPSSELEFIMGQLAQLPKRCELARYTFVILFVGAVLGIVATEVFWRCLPTCS
jgi:hypothetical protein